ncbi:MAG: hypothetical protein QXG81_04385 [Ignisphaera sp.]
MGIVEDIERRILRTMIIFVVLPPTPIIIAVIIFSYILKSFSLLLNTLIILTPIIALFTILKIWLWKTTYIEPVKNLEKHIKNLKNLGYQIDDSTYVVLPINTAVITVKSYSDIPKDRVYKVAAVETGRRGYIALIGIANENNQIYDLTKVSPQ